MEVTRPQTALHFANARAGTSTIAPVQSLVLQGLPYVHNALLMAGLE